MGMLSTCHGNCNTGSHMGLWAKEHFHHYFYSSSCKAIRLNKAIGQGTKISKCKGRKYLEIINSTEKSEAEDNSAKRGKKSLVSEKDLEFKTFLS